MKYHIIKHHMDMHMDIMKEKWRMCMSIYKAPFFCCASLNVRMYFYVLIYIYACMFLYVVCVCASFKAKFWDNEYQWHVPTAESLRQHTVYKYAQCVYVGICLPAVCDICSHVITTQCSSYVFTLISVCVLFVLFACFVYTYPHRYLVQVIMMLHVRNLRMQLYNASYKHEQDYSRMCMYVFLYVCMYVQLHCVMDILHLL